MADEFVNEFGFVTDGKKSSDSAFVDSSSSYERIRQGLGGVGPIAQSVLNNNALGLARSLFSEAVKCTSTTRPSRPVVGQLIYESDTVKLQVWNGTAWVPVGADSLPIGTVLTFSGTVIPSGYLVADGSSQLRSAYPDLFALIGTTYGPGSVPGTTFALPNYVGTYGTFIIKASGAASATSITSSSLIAVPVGTLMLYAAATAIPTGWLRADGAGVSRTSYADLFAFIGTTYGSGDGSTTFNLPNLPSSGAGSPVYIIRALNSGGIEPSTVAHASSHIRGGSDIIDADRAQVDYVPTNYTRNSGATGAGAVTDLTAHLSGIDNGAFFKTTGSASGEASTINVLTRPWNMPWGKIAFLESTSNSLSSNTVNGLTSSISLRTGRLYRASFIIQSSVSATNAMVRALGSITIDGTTWTQRAYDIAFYIGGTYTAYPTINASVVFSVASTGSKTITVQLAPVAGTWGLNATSTEKHMVLVEDLGAQ